jgi:YgiT-type zinc finger domain-containing protein
MKKDMKEPCDFCDGRLEPRHVTVDYRRGGALKVIEHVPALVCNHCGERYYSASTMRAMEAITKGGRTRKRFIRVPVSKFEVVA